MVDYVEARDHVFPPTSATRRGLRQSPTKNILQAPCLNSNGGKATDVRPANNTTSLHVGLKLHTRLMITNTQALWGKSGQSRASDDCAVSVQKHSDAILRSGCGITDAHQFVRSVIN
jgi:hypothetical protein